jgi:hypothetical protein
VRRPPTSTPPVVKPRSPDIAIPAQLGHQTRDGAAGSKTALGSRISWAIFGPPPAIITASGADHFRKEASTPVASPSAAKARSDAMTGAGSAARSDGCATAGAAMAMTARRETERIMRGLQTRIDRRSTRADQLIPRQVRF